MRDKVTSSRSSEQDSQLAVRGHDVAADKRWAIYIDIEGFGALYDREDTILWALGDLMEAVFLIGTNCYPETPNRLFAHQTGDGFIIVSEFAAKTLDVPIAIAIALLRHVSERGRFAKASIAEGGFAGINGCYPKRIRDAQRKDGRVFMGGGLMTVFPVMGTAMINAVAVEKRSPSGALLTLNASDGPRISSDCLVQDVAENDLVAIDWVNSSIPLVSELQATAGLRAPSAEAIKNHFSTYIRTTRVKQQWKANSNRFLSLGLSPHDF